MKKTLLVAMILCVCLIFTACPANDPDDTDILHIGSYQYGNMQKNGPPGNFMLLNNKVLFNHIINDKSMLCSYDLGTGEVQLHCEDATCKHTSCAAGSLKFNLEVYKGKIYGMDENLFPVVVNGDVAEVITSSEVNSLFHHDDNLYLKTADSSLVILEEGQTEPRILLEEYTGRWSVIFGNHLYANALDENIIRVDLTDEKPKEKVIVQNARGMTDGQHIYYIDNKTSQLYRCDMNGSNAELLLEQPVLLASINFDDEYFYYRLYTDQQLYGNEDSCDVYRFPKDDPSQIEKIATLPLSAFQVFTVPETGKIFVTTIADDGGHRPIYVMGTDGSNPQVLDIPES